MFALSDPIGLLGLLLLLLKGGKNGGATTPTRPAATRTPERLPAPQGERTSAPWPQALPQGLPAFPGTGWEYDEPPPKAVQQRAGQLVTQLWQQGAGASKVELTEGRWIAYRAERVKSGKNGVVAYRVKKGAGQQRLPAPTATRPPAAPAAPGATPAATPTGQTVSYETFRTEAGHMYRFVAELRTEGPFDAARFAKEVAAAGGLDVNVSLGPPIVVRYTNTAVAAISFEIGRPIRVTLGATTYTLIIRSIEEVPAGGVLTSSTAPAPSALLMRDLKMGDGLKPAAPLEDVKIVQRKLDVQPADGRFGGTTRDAVIRFQVRTGLAPNLPIEQLRARGFGAVKKATWEKLFAERA